MAKRLLMLHQSTINAIEGEPLTITPYYETGQTPEIKDFDYLYWEQFITAHLFWHMHDSHVIELQYQQAFKALEGLWRIRYKLRGDKEAMEEFEVNV